VAVCQQGHHSRGFARAGFGRSGGLVNGYKLAEHAQTVKTTFPLPPAGEGHSGQGTRGFRPGKAGRCGCWLVFNNLSSNAQQDHSAGRESLRAELRRPSAAALQQAAASRAVPLEEDRASTGRGWSAGQTTVRSGWLARWPGSERCRASPHCPRAMTGHLAAMASTARIRNLPARHRRRRGSDPSVPFHLAPVSDGPEGSQWGQPWPQVASLRSLHRQRIKGIRWRLNACTPGHRACRAPNRQNEEVVTPPRGSIPAESLPHSRGIGEPERAPPAALEIRRAVKRELAINRFRAPTADHIPLAQLVQLAKAPPGTSGPRADREPRQVGVHWSQA